MAFNYFFFFWPMKTQMQDFVLEVQKQNVKMKLAKHEVCALGCSFTWACVV